MPSFPPEIWIQIFDEVAGSEDSCLMLKQLSLVSKDLLHFARIHRYRRVTINFLYGSLASASQQLDQTYHKNLDVLSKPHLACFVRRVNLGLRLLDAPDEVLEEASQAFESVAVFCVNTSHLYVTIAHWRPESELSHFSAGIARLPLVELSLPRVDESTLRILKHLPTLRRLTLDHPRDVEGLAVDAPFPFTLDNLSLSTSIPSSIFASLVRHSSHSLRHLTVVFDTLASSASAMQDLPSIDDLHLILQPHDEHHLTDITPTLISLSNLEHFKLSASLHRTSTKILPLPFLRQLPPTLLTLTLPLRGLDRSNICAVIREGILSRLRVLRLPYFVEPGILDSMINDHGYKSEAVEACRAAGVRHEEIDMRSYDYVCFRAL